MSYVIQMMKLQSNLKKHTNVRKQIFRIINQLFIQKLFIHLDYLILTQKIFQNMIISIIILLKLLILLSYIHQRIKILNYYVGLIIDYYDTSLNILILLVTLLTY